MKNPIAAFLPLFCCLGLPALGPEPGPAEAWRQRDAPPLFESQRRSYWSGNNWYWQDPENMAAIYLYSDGAYVSID